MVKKLLSIAMALAIMLVSTVTAFAGDAPDGYEGLWYDEDRGYYYYYENGEKVTEEYREVEGNLYYFDWWGDSEIGGFVDNNGEAHFATQDSIVVDGTDLGLTNGYGWYYFEWFEEWYYFYQDGTVACEQLVDIGGKTYYFNSYCEMVIGIIGINELVNDEWVYNYYVTDDNGAIIKTPGWYHYKPSFYYSNAYWCYISNTNGVLCEGFKTIGGVDYYFSGGAMVEGAFEYWDEEAEENVFAFAKQGGAITDKKGWYEIVTTYYDDDDESSYSYWYYIDADGVVARDGFYTIGSKTYYFGYWGEMYTGYFSTDYYDDDLETWVYKYYVADINGVVVTKPGWAYVHSYDYENSSYWYYVFEDGTIARNQILTIDGDDYYFNYWGELGINGSYWVGELGEYVQTDDNGKIMNKPNTWYKCDGDYYYTKEDGTLATDEILTINGKEYVFDYDGIMNIGRNYLSSTGNYYYTDKNGVLVKDKWIQNNFDWYYAKEDGTLACDEWVDGKYYFNYSATMVVGTYYTDDYGYCVFDSNGKYVDRAGKKAGWQKLDGHWYYYDQVGEPHNGWLKSGNAYHYFDDGLMRTNSSVWGANDVRYYVDKTGKMLTGWFKDYYDEWFYADSTGKIATGWNKIGGKWYYFDDWGYMYNTEISYLYEEGEWHKFSSSGAWIGKLTDKSWVKDSYGDWYYITQGETIDGQYAVNGKTYYFDHNRMYANENYGDIWINANGFKDTGSGWRQDSYGYWFYLENGILTYGLKKIGSKWYYFQYEMTKGYFNYYDYTTGENEYGFFGNSGAWQKVGTGWYSITYPYGNKSWYYFKNGKPLTSENDYISFHTIGGKKYFLYDDGEMYTGHYYADSEAVYVFGENGLLAKGGWIKVDGDWYYTDSTGRAYIGEHTIGGKTYYFGWNGVMI